MRRVRQKPLSDVIQRTLAALQINEKVPPPQLLGALAAVLGVPVETVRNWDKRGSVPERWLREVGERSGALPEWLRYGVDGAKKGAPYSARSLSTAASVVGVAAESTVQSERLYTSEVPAPWLSPAQVASTHSGGGKPPPLKASALLRPRGAGAVLPLVLSLPTGERGRTTKEFQVIPKHMRLASAGPAASERADEVDLVGDMAFSFDWLRQNMRHTTGQLAEVQVQGDSMAPTLMGGDTVIIDEGVKNVSVDGIYVIDVFGRRLVKRVQHLFDGTLVLISDNPNYQRETIPAERASHVVVIGRVVWHGVR